MGSSNNGGGHLNHTIFWQIMSPEGGGQPTGEIDQAIDQTFGSNDVWDHAYYLRYQNQRGEYLENWWNVVNWPEINRRYPAASA